jgi:hypothetical protein
MRWCYIPPPSDGASLFDTFVSSTNYTINLTLKNNIGAVSRLYNIATSKIGTIWKSDDTFISNGFNVLLKSRGYLAVTLYKCKLKSDYSVGEK